MGRKPAPSQLPIHSVLPAVREALQGHGCAVIQAPPGAGKTTVVPLDLLNEPWMEGQKLLVLEPRRLAARNAAARMAWLLGERVGQTVGYRVRMDSRVGKDTRIEVVTEGILIRMIQSRPELSGVGCVILDEFHERSLQADLSLALLLEARAALRNDLRLLVMSATLDQHGVSTLMDNAPVITSTGRQYPVQVHYESRATGGIRPEQAVAQLARRVLNESEGDILAFLPGIGEAKRAARHLAGVPPGTDVYVLAGSLSTQDQDHAIAPSPPGRRKVVLATDVAETSITIEGVRTVIDSGLVRKPLFDPASGLTRLVTASHSRASAEQRTGRAGRTAPGQCYRLWTQVDHAARSPYEEPEIRNADLAPLALELAAWGAREAGGLRWLDSPDPDRLTSARLLLEQLGALMADGQLSPHGRQMPGTGLHPRLAHLLIIGSDLVNSSSAAAVAALLEDRDVLRTQTWPRPAELGIRLDALLDYRNGEVKASYFGATIDMAGIRQISRRVDHLVRAANGLRSRNQSQTSALVGGDNAGVLTALAYPDRIAQITREDGHRYRLRNGKMAELNPADSLAGTPFLAIAATGGQAAVSRIELAAAISIEDIELLHGSEVRQTRVTRWDSSAERVLCEVRRELGALVLSAKEDPQPDPDQVAGAVTAVIARKGLHILPFNAASRELQDRVAFVGLRDPSWPDFSDDALLANLDTWLTPFLTGVRDLASLRQLNIRQALAAGLSHAKKQELDRRAPSHLTVPTGSRIRIDYSNPSAPVLPVRLQEVFGLQETPLLDGVPVSFHLLSPAGRPVQITQDLAGFWRGSYLDVRKDMRGRYPKHYWPENPLEATPTRRAKPRGT